MFGKWLKKHPSPTAQDVIIALRRAGETRAADELSQRCGMLEPKPSNVYAYILVFHHSQERRVLNSRH